MYKYKLKIPQVILALAYDNHIRCLKEIGCDKTCDLKKVYLYTRRWSKAETMTVKVKGTVAEMVLIRD